MIHFSSSLTFFSALTENEVKLIAELVSMAAGITAVVFFKRIEKRLGCKNDWELMSLGWGKIKSLSRRNETGRLKDVSFRRTMTPIEELRDAIQRLHGVEATHHESVPVKEVFNGQTVWEGIVEVFHLTGHPKTDTVYAWLHDTGDPQQPFRPVTVLRIHPALSPVAAVRAFIVQEFRANGPVEA